MLRGKESVYQCRRCRRDGFDSRVGKIPWRSKWQATPVFLPGKFHGHRRLAVYSPWHCKRVRHDLETKQQQSPIWAGGSSVSFPFNESNFLCNFSETSTLSFLCKKLWARKKVLWGKCQLPTSQHKYWHLSIACFCMAFPAVIRAPCIHRQIQTPNRNCATTKHFPLVSASSIPALTEGKRETSTHSSWPQPQLRQPSHNWLRVRPWLLLPMLDTPHYRRLSPPMFWRSSTILLMYLLLLPIAASPSAAQAESPKAGSTGLAP